MKYKFKTKPYRHQVAALMKLLELGWGGALLMEPRTGKTKVCIDYASILHEAGKVTRVLVVCPVSVIDVWVNEIKTHCPARWRISVWDKKGRKALDLPRWGEPYLDFVIINYEAFQVPGRPTTKRSDGSVRRSKKVGGRFEVRKKLQAWQSHLMVLDESHRIKSPTAKKTATIISVGRHVPYKVIATGTAVTKKKRVFDLYGQWKFLNPESPLIKDMTLTEFKKKYGVWTDRNGFPQWLRERNPKTLHKRVHAESFAVTRDECYDLPEAFPDELVYVDLEESGPVYDAMAEEMVARIHSGEYTEASIPLVQQLRLRQITSGIARTEPSDEYPEGRFARVGKEKLRMLEDRMEDWFDQGEKLVVCASFRADLISVANLSAKRFKVKPQILMGGVKREERTQAIETFRRKEGPALFVMNPAAGSLGIDLRTSSTMIWFSLTNSYVDYTQTRDRIALSGKANRFVYLLARGTYDEVLYQALQEDGQVVKQIMASPEILLRNFR